MEDECENYFEIIQTRIEIFQSSYRNYNKLNINNFLSNLENLHDEEIKNEISSISDLENQIDYMVSDLENKFDSIFIIIRSFNCEIHKKILHDIEILRNTSKRLITTYAMKKRENGERIKLFNNSIFYLKNNESNSKLKIKDECKLDSQTGLNYIENYYDGKHYLNEEERHRVACNQEAQELEREHYYLQNALEYDQKEFAIDTENLKKINEVKNKIKDLTQSINKEVIKGRETLVEIEKDVNEYSENIDKTNEELRKAAIFKNKNNSIKYPIIMGTIFGAAGTIVPGLGNVIGATIGTGLGLALSRLEKKAITKIEPEKYKD